MTVGITIPVFSDYHAHYRQGAMLAAVCPSSARYLGRTLAMPNTQPPIFDTIGALAYTLSLRQHLPGVDVLVAAKLMPRTTPALVRELAKQRAAVALKLYPEGVTTHSSDGIPAELLLAPEAHPWFCEVLDEMQAAGLVLCLHGEMPGQDDPFEREPDFLPFVAWVLSTFPKLRVVMEHITSRASVEFVNERAVRGTARLAATITAHHLLIHCGHLYGSAVDSLGYGDGKLHPHLHCWPNAKRPPDREALLTAATSGYGCFFLGSDSAPHPVAHKETSCGCAGVFTAPVLPEALAMAFEKRSALDELPGFGTYFGDRFYGRPSVGRKMRLVREAWTVPTREAGVEPFLAGRTIPWKLEHL